MELIIYPKLDDEGGHNYHSVAGGRGRPKNIDPGTTLAAEVIFSPGERPMELGEFDAGKLMQSIYRSARSSKSGFPPNALRWLSADQRICVFERPPSTRTISFLPHRRDDIDTRIEDYDKNSHVYDIPIPWQVYLVYFDQHYNPVAVFMFFRPSPLTSMYNEIGTAPLLNFYYSSRLCNPTIEGYDSELAIPDDERNIAHGIQDAFVMIWGSGWNYDLQDALHSAMRQNVPFSMRGGEEDEEASSEDIVTFFRRWAKMDETKVLDCRWPQPYTGDRGDYLSPPTLANAIQHSAQWYYKNYTPLKGQELAVHMSNLIQSL